MEIQVSFQQGQEVQALFFGKNSFEGEGMVEVGSFDVEKITVSMENGQMAGVPWFVVWKGGKPVNKWNASLVEGVRL